MTVNADHNQLISESRAALLRALETFASGMGYRRHCLDAMREAAGEAFDEFAASGGKSGFEKAHGLTASRINLIDEDELTLTLELEGLARALRERCDVVLGRLHLRYIALSGRTTAPAEEVPVGPETICRAVRGLVEADGVRGEERTAFIESATPTLLDHLARFYQTLDERLGNAGVPLMASARPAQTAPRTGAGWSDVHANRTEAVDTAPHPASGSSPKTPLEGLQQALMRQRTGLALPESDALDPQLASSIVDQIRAWLSEQQNSGSAVPVRLGASNLGRLLAPGSSAAIEALERLFDQIAANQALPPPITEMIGRMRIPFLKLALDDDEILANPQHPALQLLDAVAEAGNTLPLRGNEHPGFSQIRAILEQRVITAATDRTQLGVAREELRAFVDERRDRAFAHAEHALELADKADRREAARLLASRALAALIDTETPAPVRAFLTQEWIHVLVATLYKLGEKHPDWRIQLEIAHELVLSLHADSYGRLGTEQAAAFRPLLIRIHAALAGIGRNRDARDAALADCTRLHHDLAAGKTPHTGSSQTPASNTPALVEARERPGTRMLHHTGYAGMQNVTGPFQNALETGMWLEVEPAGMPPLLGCVAWIGGGKRSLLVADPDSENTLIATTRSLADLDREQRLRLRNESSLTKKAAEILLRELGS